MQVELTRDFRFEAAHRLPRVPEGHKCARLHGHSYRFSVTVQGHVEETSGWLVDYGSIAQAVEPVRRRLDHYYLNEIEGLENPTSEVLAAWLWREIAPRVPGLVAVAVEETCTARCVFRGPVPPVPGPGAAAAGAAPEVAPRLDPE